MSIGHRYISKTFALLYFCMPMSSAQAREQAFSCTGIAEPTTLFIDFERRIVRGFSNIDRPMPAAISDEKIVWRDAPHGVTYSLDRYSGGLTIVAGEAIYNWSCQATQRRIQ